MRLTLTLPPTLERDATLLCLHRLLARFWLPRKFQFSVPENELARGCTKVTLWDGSDKITAKEVASGLIEELLSFEKPMSASPRENT